MRSVSFRDGFTDKIKPYRVHVGAAIVECGTADDVLEVLEALRFQSKKLTKEKRRRKLLSIMLQPKI